MYVLKYIFAEIDKKMSNYNIFGKEICFASADKKAGKAKIIFSIVKTYIFSRKNVYIKK